MSGVAGAQRKRRRTGARLVSTSSPRTPGRLLSERLTEVEQEVLRARAAVPDAAARLVGDHLDLADRVALQGEFDHAVGGGGARSSLWRQIQADVYGQPVSTVAAQEGAAYGAAVLGGVAMNIWSSVDNACDTVVSLTDRVEPDAASVRVLARQYERFKKIYPALKGITS